MAHLDEPVAGPRRGRPPRFTRPQIVEAVTAMLMADARAPLTIARAAEAVGARPTALYRHFTDRDDLVSAVARHAFAETRPPIDPDGSWQEQVRAWMVAVYDRSRQVPQLVHLMASGESADWLVGSSYLAAVLETCGVHDDRFMAEAVYLVGTTTMGHAMIHAAQGPKASGALARVRLDRLDEPDAERMARLLPGFEAMRDDGFAHIADWTVTLLEQRLAARELDREGPTARACP